MYKILNWLFGWDYVYWKNCATHGISRVKVNTYNKPYYTWALGVVVMIDDKMRPEIMWLTCTADKYIKNKEATNDKMMANTKEVVTDQDYLRTMMEEVFDNKMHTHMVTLEGFLEFVEEKKGGSDAQ